MLNIRGRKYQMSKPESKLNQMSKSELPEILKPMLMEIKTQQRLNGDCGGSSSGHRRLGRLWRGSPEIWGARRRSELGRRRSKLTGESRSEENSAKEGFLVVGESRWWLLKAERGSPEVTMTCWRSDDVFWDSSEVAVTSWRSDDVFWDSSEVGWWSSEVGWWSWWLMVVGPSGSGVKSVNRGFFCWLVRGMVVFVIHREIERKTERRDRGRDR